MVPSNSVEIDFQRDDDAVISFNSVRKCSACRTRDNRKVGEDCRQAAAAAAMPFRYRYEESVSRQCVSGTHVPFGRALRASLDLPTIVSFVPV
ncbi:hypothetical protein HZH68_011539 [Vespula germanica]|uniref:Uncharacterized protein n=1 Tax=Vespula germanica TaxID=30212 RepID=A0A834JUW3_VESGE|nr:hypothetical protein HZH68_011539 [Vespula germanica]